MLTAAGFFAQFQSRVTENAVYEDGRSYLKIYQTDEPTFTQLINKIVIHDIIQSSGLTPQHEYFRIDTVGWNGRYQTLDERTAKKIGLNRHLWDLMVAVEHENDKADWLDELIKLIHIRCPLKVVISYNYCDCREQLEWDKLNYAAACMQKIEAFRFCEGEEYLVILGNAAPKDKTQKSYGTFDYRAYLYHYDKNCFEQLE